MVKKKKIRRERGITIGRVEVEADEDALGEALQKVLDEAFEAEIADIIKGRPPSPDRADFRKLIAKMIFEGGAESHLNEEITAIESRIRGLDAALREARLSARRSSAPSDAEKAERNIERLLRERGDARDELHRAQDAVEDQRQRLIDYAEQVLGKAGKQ